MKQGITVWLDVPLEALARRIAAVGTASRPLLHEESGDPYTKVNHYFPLKTLSRLLPLLQMSELVSYITNVTSKHQYMINNNQ